MAKFKIGDTVTVHRPDPSSDWKVGESFKVKRITTVGITTIYWDIDIEHLNLTDIKIGVMEECLRPLTKLGRALA